MQQQADSLTADKGKLFDESHELIRVSGGIFRVLHMSSSKGCASHAGSANKSVFVAQCLEQPNWADAAM